MKKFFAYWIISLVFSLLVGLITAGIDYLFGTLKEGYYGECLDTLLGGCFSEPTDMLGIYPASAFGMMILAYPIFRAVIGSFKTVFSKNTDNNEA
ncbi:MAG: hypothetical protein HRU23_02660 [Gammaproteobacteria bacterium]|nr:hypothetical protein [Gammaproteobacteria bacterium]